MQEPPSKPLRTLIVDPSKPFRDGVVRWAEDRPDVVVVGTAGGRRDALSALEALDPDLVLVDAVLPDSDGFHLVRSIKALPDAPLVVVVTFVSSTAVQNEAYAAGADGFVAKDDFSAAFELLLGDLIDAGVRSPERSARRESRIAPDP